MGRQYDTISFLSDLGTIDESVGLVKAVVRDIAPHARVVDLTHEITPFDVRAGSLALARSIAYVPTGLIMAVVDAGAGVARRCVAIEVAGGEGVFVGPDNGLLAPAVAMAGGAGRAVVLTNVEFHLASPGALSPARDILAPAAAALCNGTDLLDLGEQLDAGLLIPGVIPLPRDGADGSMVCEVLWVDRFGNAQLNVGLDDLTNQWGEGWGDRLRITCGGDVRSVPLLASADEIPPGGPGLIVDCFGMLALSYQRDSAAARLGIAATDQLTLARHNDSSDATPGLTTMVTIGPRR
jgi:S-adenosyl-L-methionine hydrolase (adenosine-forming)